MTHSHIARLQVAVMERAAREDGRAARAEVAAAISRAERGEELSVLDLDLGDPAERAAYTQALTDVLEEKARRGRSAAAMLAARRLGRKLPQ